MVETRWQSKIMQSKYIISVVLDSDARFPKYCLVHIVWLQSRYFLLLLSPLVKTIEQSHLSRLQREVRHKPGENNPGRIHSCPHRPDPNGSLRRCLFFVEGSSTRPLNIMPDYLHRRHISLCSRPVPAWPSQLTAHHHSLSRSHFPFSLCSDTQQTPRGEHCLRRPPASSEQRGKYKKGKNRTSMRASLVLQGLSQNS